ncbi:MAG: hypothetical protein J5787_05955 [Alphaproteobacteria bacterium]|nr:hypothetical protein [Alphaproteobacteria bacterium]
MKQTLENFERQQEPQRNQVALTERDVDGIRVGDRFDYRGARTITYGALYDAEVVQITENTIILSLVIDQTSAPIERYGTARKYRTAIAKKDIGRTERLYEKRSWDK